MLTLENPGVKQNKQNPYKLTDFPLTKEAKKQNRKYWNWEIKHHNLKVL